MDIQDWCRQSGLSPATAAELRHEGFGTAEDLRDVTEDDVMVTFQKRRKLPLQQCVALREALKDLLHGKARRRRQDGVSIAEWSRRHGLDAETSKVLENEGFATADDMKYVTAYDVKTTFQKEGVLPLRQCIALRQALESGGMSHLRSEEQPHFVHGDRAGAIGQVTEGEYCGQQLTNNDSTHKPIKSSRSYVPPRARTTHAQLTASELGHGIPPSDAEGGTRQGSVTPLPENGECRRLGRRMKGKHLHDSEEEYRLVVVGSDKSGKSRTVRSILGHQDDTILQPWGKTACGQLYRGLVHGRPVQILDTSGWLHDSRRHSDTAAIITTDLCQLHPGPHALLYTVDVSTRYTKEHSTRFRQLDAIFNHQLHLYLIVVFTHGDSLGGVPFQELLRTAPSDLKQVLNRCEDRYVLLDNTNPQQDQVDKLFHLLKELTAQRLGKPCLTIAEGAGTVEEVARRLSEVEEEMVESSSVIQTLAHQQKEKLKQVKRSRKVLEKRAGRGSQEQRELVRMVKDLENSMKQFPD